MADDDKADNGSGPIEEIKAYFKTVPWIYYKIGSSVHYELICDGGLTVFCLLVGPEVIGQKNLGQHLNEVFADRNKMEAVPCHRPSITRALNPWSPVLLYILPSSDPGNQRSGYDRARSHIEASYQLGAHGLNG